ncbi:hypothetical protein [Pseudophaeobacter sp.]|uniref:hypothetical protein n=1 Tax=Pseudophaeobacter sp. TaxID=1971739 RepID=UPI003267A0C5
MAAHLFEQIIKAAHRSRLLVIVHGASAIVVSRTVHGAINGQFSRVPFGADCGSSDVNLGFIDAEKVFNFK